MTFVITRLRLVKTPTPDDLRKLSRLSTVYGIRGLSIQGQDLVIEYDGSRLHEAEVLAAVRGAKVAVDPMLPFPLGGFDYSGQFKDYAWPMTALTPINQKQK